MKKYLSICTSLLLLVCNITPFVFSETIVASRIEITAPTTVRVGEAFDVKLRVVDSNGNVATGYRGSVIFNTESIGDIVPSPGKAIPFTADYNGEKTFSKGVIFKKSGNQKLSAFDLNTDINGEITINVLPATVNTGTTTETVTIITPDNGTKITDSSITISGKTRKNSKVIVNLNGQPVGTTEVSDTDGVFVKSITNITQENNIVTAQLVDSSNKVIATSSEVKFTLVTSQTSIYGVAIMPASTVEVSSPIEIIVDATPGLPELSINLDGTILVAKEKTSGKYSVDTVAPQKVGIYKPIITQKNSSGKLKTSDSPTSLTVTEKKQVQTYVYGVNILPTSTVEVNSPIEIIVDATPNLPDLSINLDGTILVTKELKSGKYSVNAKAPLKVGVYKPTIIQKNSSGKVITSDSPTSLTVTEKIILPPVVVPPAFRNIQTVVKDGKIVFDFLVDNVPADLNDFKIVYGKNADNLNSEVTTYSLEKISSLKLPGGYTWYIDKLPEGTYTFKIFGRTKDGSLITKLSSEPIVGRIGSNSCTIGNITDLFIKTDKTKSIISWSPLPTAVSYNLYKVSPTGDYTLFQNTTEPTYTLYLSTGAIVYENFVVKALCDDTTESKEYSGMSRIQSGPAMITIIVIISTILSALVMRRRYN